MSQNICQFREHQLVQVPSRVSVRINAAPRWTDNESISSEWLHLQEVFVEHVVFTDGLAIDFQVLSQHLNFGRIEVIHHELVKLITKMDGDPSDTTKWLKDLLDLSLPETLSKVV